MDYVAIQERATKAEQVTQSGLVPVWRLWTPATKSPAEEAKPQTAPKRSEPVNAAG
jgi:hypothetical protein